MTHPVLSDLFFVINARADYLSVLFCVSGDDTTWTVSLTELILPDGKAL
jgi:hypothetical protein